MKTVVYVDGMPLYLSSVRRNRDGRVKGGWVVNGCWDFSVNGNQVECREHSYSKSIVRSFPFTSIVEVSVPDTVKGDYNDVITYADSIHPSARTPSVYKKENNNGT